MTYPPDTMEENRISFHPSLSPAVIDGDQFFRQKKEEDKEEEEYEV